MHGCHGHSRDQAVRNTTKQGIEANMARETTAGSNTMKPSSAISGDMAVPEMRDKSLESAWIALVVDSHTVRY